MYFCRKILGTTRGSKLRNEDFSAATSSVLLSKGNLCRNPRFFFLCIGIGARVKQSVQGAKQKVVPAGLCRHRVHTSMSLGDRVGGSPPYILLPRHLS